MGDLTRDSRLDDPEWWPCACVRTEPHTGKRQMRLNAPTVRKCRSCGISRDESNRAAIDVKRKTP